MPSIPDDNKTSGPPQIAGAICGPPPASSSTENGDNVVLPQPRQPSNLQGLLRFAMETTKADDPTPEARLGPMDEERKKFLEEALKAMTIDVVEVLQEQIKKLQDVSTLKADDDPSDFLNALDTILDHVDNIDIANDFHKIGGFMILRPCLMCEHPELRAGGCNLLAELCQNNPYCQNIVLENEFMPVLLEILDKESDQRVIVKDLYALSALIRDSASGFSQLIHYRGLDAFKRILEKGDDRCVVKITFLLAALCRQQADLKSRLIFMEYLPILISLISKDRQPGHEHVLSLLVSLIEDSTAAVSECRNPKYNLKTVLQNYIAQIKNKEECLEEEQYCKRLLFLLFGES